MFTKVALSFVLVGAMLAGSDTISKRICCMKNAYCCSVKRDCCQKSAMVESAVAASEFKVSAETARPTCCAKPAYCCTVKRSCCPSESSAQAIA